MINDTERATGTVMCVVCEKMMDLSDLDNPAIATMNHTHYHSQCGEYHGWPYQEAIRYAVSKAVLSATIRNTPGGTFVFEGLSRRKVLEIIKSCPDADIHIQYASNSKHPGRSVYLPHILIKADTKWSR